ncbi:MAG: hypothetical protein Q9M50_02735 [Methylococcales bacterium]|nr:hypothetical protein [Methylococcales bacterium]
MIKHRYFFSLVIGTVFLASPLYAESKPVMPSKTAQSTAIAGKVTEILNVTGYTYVEVDTGKQKVWAAAPTTTLAVGDKVSFSPTMPMENFHSKSLKRDFPVVYFIGGFITDKATPAVKSTSKHKRTEPKPPVALVKKIEPLTGGKTIVEIYKEKAVLKGKTIRIRGLVTKFTAGVMGKNWIHIRDNSTLDDLTVTTNSVTKLDDVVVIEGALVLDKDFGYGYVYPVMLENAKIIKK